MTTSPHNTATRCLDLIDGLQVPEPFDLDAVLAVLAVQRGKRIRATATQLSPGESKGLLLSTDGADDIFYPEDASPLHARHIVLHALGHLLMRHDVCRVASNSAGEVEAELFATLLALRVTTPTPSHRADLAIRAAHRALEPMWQVMVDAVPSTQPVGVDAAILAITTSPGARARSQLYRRVLDIRDAQLELRRYVPVAARARALVAARAQNLPDHATAVLAAATELAVALNAYRAGSPATEPDGRTSPPPCPASTGLLDDAVWLLRVATTLQYLGPHAGAAPGLGQAAPGRTSTAS